MAAAWETSWLQQHRDEAAGHDPNNQQELDPRLGLDACRRSDAQQLADGEAALRFRVALPCRLCSALSFGIVVVVTVTMDGLLLSESTRRGVRGLRSKGSAAARTRIL